MSVSPHAEPRCIWCERTAEELGGLQYVRFEGTSWTMCILCYWKLEDEGYMAPNPSRINSYYSGYRKKSIPRKTKTKVYIRDRSRCQYCGSNNEHSLSIDHIMPESRGGKANLSNLVVACMECNAKKGARTPEESGMKLINDPRF